MHEIAQLAKNRYNVEFCLRNLAAGKLERASHF